MVTDTVCEGSSTHRCVNIIIVETSGFCHIQDTEFWVSENFLIANDYKTTVSECKYMYINYKSLQNYHYESNYMYIKNYYRIPTSAGYELCLFVHLQIIMWGVTNMTFTKLLPALDIAPSNDRKVCLQRRPVSWSPESQLGVPSQGPGCQEGFVQRCSFQVGSNLVLPLLE